MATAPAPKLVTVRWKEFDKSFQLQRKIAQMLEQQILADITLVCEGTRMKCHRLILAACSPFFADIISRNSNPDLVICLVGIKSWQMRGVISFMYRGVIENVPANGLEEFFEVAKQLRIYGLYDYNLTSQRQTESRSEDSLSVLSGTSSSNNGEAEIVLPVMLKKRKHQQMSTSEPIFIDLVDTDSSESGRSDTEVDHGSSGRTDVVIDGSEQHQEGLPSGLPITKPFKKRSVVVSDVERATVDITQSSGNAGITPDATDARVEVTETRITQNENDSGESSKKIKMDRTGSCGSSNGSLLDPNRLLLQLQSEERAAEETVRTTQLHIETKLKEIRRNTKRGRKPKISLPSRPDITVYTGNPPDSLTITRSEEVLPQNHHQPSVPEGISINSSQGTQAPTLASEVADYERLLSSRVIQAICMIMYGYTIEQTSLSTGISAQFLTEYLRLYGSTIPHHQSQQTEQYVVSNPTADYRQSSTYSENELQENAKRIHEQMMYACFQMSMLQGQFSSTEPNNPPK